MNTPSPIMFDLNNTSDEDDAEVVLNAEVVNDIVDAVVRSNIAWYIDKLIWAAATDEAEDRNNLQVLGPPAKRQRFAGVGDGGSDGEDGDADDEGDGGNGGLVGAGAGGGANGGGGGEGLGE